MAKPIFPDACPHPHPCHHHCCVTMTLAMHVLSLLSSLHLQVVVALAMCATSVLLSSFHCDLPCMCAEVGQRVGMHKDVNVDGCVEGRCERVNTS